MHMTPAISYAAPGSLEAETAYNVVRQCAGRTSEGEAIAILSNLVTQQQHTPGTLSFVSVKADIDRDGRMDAIDIHSDGSISVSGFAQTLKMAQDRARTLFERIGQLTESPEISTQQLSDLLMQVRKDVGIFPGETQQALLTQWAGSRDEA